MRSLAALAATTTFASAFLAACVGSIDHRDPSEGAARGGDHAGDEGGDGVSPAPGAALGAPGPARVWRLTTQQYDNTVRDLLGDVTAPARLFTPDIGGTGFTNNAELLAVGAAQATEFSAAAARLARDTVTNRLERVFPCPASQLADAACARKFVESFGRRAFRRPLEPDEVSAYLDLHATGARAIDGATGVAVVIETMLQSPHFLYRSEVGDRQPDARGEVRLTAHELATALAYFFTATTPDDELLAAASDGTLATAGGLRAQIERLASDPRARAPMLEFYRQLLDYDDLANATRDPKLFPKFEAVLASMKRETQTFLENVIFDGDARLGTLLTAPYSYVDANLAPIYRLPEPSGTAPARVDLDPAERAGLLTQAGFLTVHSLPDETSPPRRGKAVLEQFLCVHVPPPVDNIPEPPAPAGKETTRQKFERLTTAAVCMACHRMLNPAGFPFEGYDVVGAVRTTDNTLPVDTRADLTGIPGIGAPVSGAVELARRMAQSPEVEACHARQTLRYAFGRDTGSDDDSFVSAMLERFRESGGNVRELFSAVATTRAFTHRRLDRTGGAP